MTPATQVKLLRVLQERTFRRLGGRAGAAGRRARDRGDQRRTRSTRCSGASCARTCTTASTSSRSRSRRCASGARTSRCSCRRSCRSSTSATAGTCGRSTRTRCALLERYHWPGNIRELRNVIERATIVAERRVHHPRAPAAAPADAGMAGADAAIGRGAVGRRGLDQPSLTSRPARRSTKPRRG